MSARLLPIFNDATPHFTERVTLDGREYRLRFRWNARGRAYYVTIERGGEVLVAGIRLVRRYGLLRQWRAVPGIPPGELVVVDLEDDFRTGEINPESLGERYRLVYIPEGT